MTRLSLDQAGLFKPSDGRFSPTTGAAEGIDLKPEFSTFSEVLGFPRAKQIWSAKSDLTLHTSAKPPPRLAAVPDEPAETYLFADPISFGKRHSGTQGSSSRRWFRSIS
jgi:hypothetical protein